MFGITLGLISLSNGRRKCGLRYRTNFLKLLNSEGGYGTGCSDPVLVYFGGELDDNGNAFAVWRFRRGGRGDTTSTFWDWDYPLVTHWCPLEAPDE